MFAALLQIHSILRWVILILLLLSIIQAAIGWSKKRELREVVLTPLLQACEEMKSCKQPRILKEIALILAVDDLPSANEVVEMIQKESIKRQAKASIEKREWLGAHEFLPHYAKTAR